MGNPNLFMLKLQGGVRQEHVIAIFTVLLDSTESPVDFREIINVKDAPDQLTHADSRIMNGRGNCCCPDTEGYSLDKW